MYLNRFLENRCSYVRHILRDAPSTKCEQLLRCHVKKMLTNLRKMFTGYAIEVLPESVFQHIASWLDTQPAEIQYDDLKAALLRTFCLSPSVRARRILDLLRQLPGDCTLTQAWHNINTLCQLPELDATTGLHKQLDLVKKIWLMCLTPQVRSSLATLKSWSRKQRNATMPTKQQLSHIRFPRLSTLPP